MSQATLTTSDSFPTASASPAAKPVARFRVRADRWTAAHLLGATGMAAVGVLATRDAWADIYRHAVKDQEYSHIWLVPVVAFFMVYVRRLRNCRFVRRPPEGSSVLKRGLCDGII